jgi:ABC-type lipoprotein release transport system permease subunit
MKLPMLPADKANHLIAGALIFTVAAALAGAVGVKAAQLLGLFAAVAIGALKELLDHLANRRAAAADLPPPHGVEFMDTLFTSAGGLLVWVAVVLAGG